MAKQRRNNTDEELLVNKAAQEVDNRSFMEKYQMSIIGLALGLVFLIGAYLAYNTFYKQPREEKAMTQMYRAEYQFQRDSFALALEGPGAQYPGFLDIMDSYSGTKAANLAKYYSGISYLNLNRYEEAISYLKSFKESGNVTSITKYGALGDAYSEMNDMDKAISNYKKAVSNSNESITPYYLYKLGLLANRQGDKAAAKSAFERIKSEFPQSEEATDAAKYIGLIQ